MHIDGPAGNLEARFELATDPNNITAVLCHPHPQYGGSMHDAVLQTCVDELTDAGVNCLRFNFRGVGASAGSYDGGTGEAYDLLAASAWVTQHQATDQLWWLGYSFGAAVVWRGLQSAQQTLPYIPARVVLIAPPVGVMDFSSAEPGPLQWPQHLDAIAGDRDDFIDAGKFQNWPGVHTHTIAGADHFFAGHHEMLATTLGDAIRD